MRACPCVHESLFPSTAQSPTTSAAAARTRTLPLQSSAYRTRAAFTAQCEARALLFKQKPSNQLFLPSGSRPAFRDLPQAKFDPDKLERDNDAAIANMHKSAANLRQARERAFGRALHSLTIFFETEANNARQSCASPGASFVMIESRSSSFGVTDMLPVPSLTAAGEFGSHTATRR